MVMNWFDWSFVVVFFILSLVIGLAVSRKAGASVSDFFLSGRNMPWWLLGVSMVATTFSCDTPNLVTDIVRTKGVSGNWLWWSFLLTGMLTVFVYAKLWRRLKVLTDLEFYELRYSGRGAAFLRGFRAVYLGIFFNVLVMASVSLAAIKLGGVMLHMSPAQTLVVAAVVTVIYSSLGGLKSVLITDFFQFIIAMAGAIWAAVVIVNLPRVGGLTGLFSRPEVLKRLSMLPDFSDKDAVISLLVIPLAVQWWSVWYPGSEPGGGGFIAQRMLSAKNERHAMGATLFFNAAHYAMRPWPWILVALCSLVVFPTVESLRAAFPNVDPAVVKNDLAYPAMMTLLPHGLIGMVAASLIAAYMSTISTQLNWGSSYVVNDVYRRFVNPAATEKVMVRVGRVTTVVLMVLAGLLALCLSNALQAFNILLQIGAGTGLLFILRWFWWRINAASEIAAMVVSFLVALYFQLIHVQVLGFPALDNSTQLVLGVAVTTIGWIAVTFMTRPSDTKTLRSFYRLARPGGPGWKKVVEEAEDDHDSVLVDGESAWELPLAILCMVAGCITVYSALFGVGYLIYGRYLVAVVYFVISSAGTGFLIRNWRRLRAS